MTISVDSHDILGKLTIIKNYLSVLLENPTLPEKEKEYIKHSFEANEFIIQLIKQKTSQAAS